MAKDPALRAFEEVNRLRVREIPCAQCYAAPGQTCFTGRVFREASHLPRVKAAFFKDRRA